MTIATRRSLTERRKADRETMAKELEAVIRNCGATFTREEGGGYPGPRCIQLNVAAARGLCVSIDFDGDSCQPDVFCLPWHVSTDSDARLSDSFPGRSVNPHHFRKSTLFAEGFTSLCAMLTAGLVAARDGWAFDAEREAAMIAKHGTAADRMAFYAKCREDMAAERAAS